MTASTMTWYNELVVVLMEASSQFITIRVSLGTRRACLSRFNLLFFFESVPWALWDMLGQQSLFLSVANMTVHAFEWP